MDFTKIDDVGRHRYRFYFMFPWGDVIENVFAVPGYLSASEADQQARQAWAMSLHEIVGTSLPANRNKLFSESMAAHAAVEGSFVVMRPGEVAQ